MTGAHGSLSLLVWVAAATALALASLAGLLALWLGMRKSLRAAGEGRRDRPRAGAEHPAALLATIQGVIERLREQEKEAARLYQRERQRALSTARLSDAVIRHMPTGLLLVNAGGLITLANPAAERALGTAGLSYRNFREVLGGEAPLARLLGACLDDRATFLREELAHRTPAGEERRLGATISPVEADEPGGKKAAGALCLLSDLSELAALEAQVRLRESLATLGEMSACIAHEWKNSLGIVSGYAQMLARELPQGEASAAAAQIVRETRRLSQAVRELLQFAGPMEVAAEPVVLAELVEQVVADEQRAAPEVCFGIEGEFGEVTGDGSLLRQAVANLARNAAEAAQAGPSGPARRGGRVSIRGGLEERAGQPVARLSVADNGPGIPREALAKLFVPFYTTKPGGSGLGLALVQKIAVQHGGRIEARNLAEGGAEFTLWLPIRRRAGAEKLAKSFAPR
jgi:two-component system, NtrC family, sensor histidine kinase PilS